MKSAREFMQHIADNMDTLSDDDVTDLIAARDREIRAAALREAADYMDFPIMEREFSVELRRMADRIERDK